MLKEDIYESDIENQILLVNKNSYGMIITKIDSSGDFHLIKILEPIINSTIIKLYEQDFSGDTMIKTINCFSLQIYNNYYFQ